MNVRDLIKLKKLEEKAVVKEKWCEEQQRDLEMLFEMVDNLIACAVASNTSTQAYLQLEQSKSNFKNEFFKIAEKYRHI